VRKLAVNDANVVIVDICLNSKKKFETLPDAEICGPHSEQKGENGSGSFVQARGYCLVATSA
jgi:hypothetical protein